MGLTNNFISNLNNPKTPILFFLVAFIFINLIFFPKIYTSNDEYGYLKNSFLLQQGNLIIKNPEYACEAKPTDQGFAIGRFIGKSIFLIPFTWFGLGGIMLSGLIVHLLNFFLIYLILRKLNYKVLYSLLYLFVPVLVYESRTLYTELLVLSCVLLAFYFYIPEINKKHWLMSGLFFGLATFVRYDAGFFFMAFFIAALFKNKSKLVYLTLGFVPLIGLILFFNNFLFGNFLSTGYGNNTVLSLLLSILTSFKIETFLISFLVLLLVYPLMLISPYFNKKFDFKLEFFLFSIFYLLLNSAFTDFLVFDLNLASLFSYRLRYLAPLIGILIIPYAPFCDELITKVSNTLKFNKNTALLLIFLVLCFGAAVLSFVHYTFLNDRYAVSNQILNNIPEKTLTIGSSDDCIYFMRELFGDRKYLNVSLHQSFMAKYEDTDIYKFIEKQLSQGGGVFVLDLYYFNVADSNSLRKTQVIDKERDKIKKFIGSNKQDLDLIFETDNPHHLKIYKFK